MSTVSAEVGPAPWADANMTAPGVGTDPTTKTSANPDTNTNPDEIVFRLGPCESIFRMESNATLRNQ